MVKTRRKKGSLLHKIGVLLTEIIYFSKSKCQVPSVSLYPYRITLSRISRIYIRLSERVKLKYELLGSWKPKDTLDTGENMLGMPLFCISYAIQKKPEILPRKYG